LASRESAGSIVIVCESFLHQTEIPGPARLLTVRSIAGSITGRIDT